MYIYISLLKVTRDEVKLKERSLRSSGGQGEKEMLRYGQGQIMSVEKRSCQKKAKLWKAKCGGQR